MPEPERRVLDPPGNRSRREEFDAQMGKDLLDLSRRNVLEIRFDDRIHQNPLYPGMPFKNLCLIRELPELRFPENRLPAPGLEG